MIHSIHYQTRLISNFSEDIYCTTVHNIKKQDEHTTRSIREDDIEIQYTVVIKKQTQRARSTQSTSDKPTTKGHRQRTTRQKTTTIYHIISYARQNIMDPPKKYCKVNGIMKLNPEYKKYKEAQAKQAAASGGSSVPIVVATTVLNSAEALPVISSMDDYMTLNDNIDGPDIPLAESTNATIEMLQEPEIAAEAGLQTDDMIDQLGDLLEKYEIPIGLTNKLMMLSEYQSLEFIVDDSGSMRLDTDTINKLTRKPMSRWNEAHIRIKEMIEIISYVPFEQIGIEFLNRKDRISLKRNGRTPKVFMKNSFEQIDSCFKKGPSGTTPALEKLQESFLRGQGANIARYFFGDGKPNGGMQAINEIVNILKKRSNPEQNPMTFLSCTDDDDAVEWMKDAEEVRFLMLLMFCYCCFIVALLLYCLLFAV